MDICGGGAVNRCRIRLQHRMKNGEFTPWGLSWRARITQLWAHGCNLGAYMAQLTPDVAYEQLKRIAGWQLTEEAQRRGGVSWVRPSGRFWRRLPRCIPMR
jgi:hypothetical protein